MANRTVSVELQANVAGFVAGAKEAEAATDKLDKKLTDIGQHGKDFAEAEKSAAGLAAAVKEPTAATAELADKVDGAGRQMKETAVDARFLADELKKARTAALEAAAAFAVTGDKTNLTEFRKQTAYAGQLGRVEKALVKDAEQTGTQVGTQLAKSTESAFSGGFREMITNPYVLAALAPAVVELGTGVGALLLTGVGLAGVGAGIAGQISNPAVALAGKELGTKVSDGFREATGAFAQPIEDSLMAVGQEWDRLALGLHTTFDYLAPSVKVLTAGALGFADALIPALERAAVEAQPLIQTLANWLPNLGGDLASLFDTLSAHADTFNDALKMILGTTDLLVKGVDLTTNSFAGLFKIAEMTTGSLDALISWGGHGSDTKALKFMTEDTTSAARAAAIAKGDFAALAQQLNATTMTADMLAGAMADKVFNAMVSADRASLTLHESLTRLSESFKTNGKSIDINTSKGQANREAVLAAVGANIQFYDTMIKSGYSAKQASDAYDQNTAALEAQLRKAGLTKVQISALIGEYRKVPAKVDTDIAMNGLAQALNDLNELLRRLNGLPSLKKITVETIHIDTRHATPYAKGGFWSGRAAADGMFLAPSDPGTILAGEPQTRGEWLIPQDGISQQRAEYLVGSAAAAHGLSLARSVPAMGGGWGGMATPVSGPDNSVHLTVQAMRANLDYTELQAWQRSAEVRQRVGRPR
jgi:hypothetical protein